MDLQNLEPCLFVRKWHLDFTVEATGAHQRGIERVRSVSRHDEFCAPERIKAVHLVQQLLCACVRAHVGRGGLINASVSPPCDPSVWEGETDLHQRALDLAIRAGALGEPSSANGVDLVHEDDAGLVVARITEHLAHYACRLADVLVDDGGGDDLEEVGVERRRDRTG